MRVIFLFLLFHCYFLVKAQHQDKVDFTHAKVDISVDANTRGVKGNVVYQFEVLRKVDTVFLDAQNLELLSVRLNNKKVKAIYDGKKIIVHKSFKADKTYTLDIVYTAEPKQTLYFTGWDTLKLHDNDPSVLPISDRQTMDSPQNQIWTQGQGKYTSHWLPSFDDMNEKVVFDLDITSDKAYEVIANGKLSGTQQMDDLKKWSFTMERPMSSYLVAFVIGDYKKKTVLSHNGIPLGLYFYPGDSSLVEPTYRYTKRIFEFLEKEIGIAYPWQTYNQIPVRDFLYAGMENTGTTIFSDSYVIDSIAFKDKNYVTVNAHEMAHQWFGNLVTEVDSGSHWLHEGFATYYALLAEKEIFGKEHYYWKLYESAQELQDLSKKNMGEALLDPKASSLTFYEKGAWALHMLRKQLGEIQYKKGIQRYLDKYGFKNATVADFLEEMELTSGADLSGFREKWLEGTAFPFGEAKEILIEESDDLNSFFQLQKELMISNAPNETILKRFWENTGSSRLKNQIIQRYYKSFSEDFINEVLRDNDLMARQALSIAVEQISPELKLGFESLLDDESYHTIEQILFKLWMNYPADRTSYLNRTKNKIGFPTKNIRLLWLTLALLTTDYEPDDTNKYYMELSGYTSPMYSYEVRQTAFGYLEKLIGFSDRNLLDLIGATQHRSWQFKKFARSLLDTLLEQKEYRTRVDTLKVKLNEAELRYISDKLIIE